MWRWVRDVVDELLLVESRLPRTLGALLWPPGRLWAEWRQGRRASYVGPLRLYLLAAVPFFFAFSWAESRSTSASLYSVMSDFVFATGMPPEYRVDLPVPAPMGPAPDSVRSDPELEAAWRSEYERREAQRRAYRVAVERQQGAWFQAAVEILPVAVGLILVPWLALLLRFGTRERFASLLVGSLHIHAVAYLLAMVGLLFGAGLWVGLAVGTAYMVAATYRVLDDTFKGILGRLVLVPTLYVTAFLIGTLGVLRLVSRVAPGWVYGG